MSGLLAFCSFSVFLALFHFFISHCYYSSSCTPRFQNHWSHIFHWRSSAEVHKFESKFCFSRTSHWQPLWAINHPLTGGTSLLCTGPQTSHLRSENIKTFEIENQLNSDNNMSNETLSTLLGALPPENIKTFTTEICLKSDMSNETLGTFLDALTLCHVLIQCLRLSFNFLFIQMTEWWIALCVQHYTTINKILINLRPRLRYHQASYVQTHFHYWTLSFLPNMILISNCCFKKLDWWCYSAKRSCNY